MGKKQEEELALAAGVADAIMIAADATSGVPVFTVANQARRYVASAREEREAEKGKGKR